MNLDFVHVSLVELMKDLVFLMINAKIIFFVDIKIVLPHLVMIMLIVVVINSRVQIIQMIMLIMLKKLGS